MSKKQLKIKEVKDPIKKQTHKIVEPVHEETEEEKLAKQQQIIDNLNAENVMKYLKNIENSPLSSNIVEKASQSLIEGLTLSLKMGSIMMPKKAEDISKLISIEEKISVEQQKQRQMRAKRDQIQRKIQYLDRQIRAGNHSSSQEKDEKELNVDIKEVLTKQEHEKRVKQMIQERLERSRKHAQIAQKIKKKQEIEEQKRKSMKLLEQEKQKQQKRMMIGKKIKERKEVHERFLSQQLKLRKDYELVKQKSHLYEKMQSRYQTEILLPILEEKKMKLKKIRDFHHNFDVQEIKRHERSYLIQREESLKKEKDKQKSEEKWSYKPPARTERLQKLLQDERIKQKQKLEERRKHINQKLRRQELFINELKEKHQPKLDQEKKRQIENRLVLQKKKKEKHENNSKKLGLDYLEIAKHLKRSQTTKSDVQTTEKQSKQKEKGTETYHSNLNRSHEFYENIRRKKINDILNSQEQPQNKYLMLRMQQQKLEQKIKQQEQLMKQETNEEVQNYTAELILSSIKAKMNIFDLYKMQKSTNIDDQ